MDVEHCPSMSACPHAFGLTYLVLPTCSGGKGKCMILYSAVSSPFDRSKRFALHFLADLFIPTPTRLLSIPRYSCIRLIGLGCRGENEKADLHNGGKGDSNTCSLNCESGILPLGYTAADSTGMLHGIKP